MAPNPSTTQPACPSCGGRLARRRRRWTDRLLSLFAERGRYRCTAACCAWEGLLPIPPAPREHRAQRSMSYRHREVLQPSRGATERGRG